MKARRIYLDVCCINRPFDEQDQDRIRLETEAVLIILNHIELQEWQWIGSQVLDYEIERTTDYERKRRVKLFTTLIHESVPVGNDEVERAKDIESLGFHAYDALHIACAESGGAEVLLTVDDHFLGLGARHGRLLRVRVENPLAWLNKGATAWEHAWSP